MVTQNRLTDRTLANFPTTGVHLIEAGAGTGKTFCLAHIFLRHILQGRPLRQILAVTFTNAASEALKIRIRERLQTALLSCERLLEGGFGEPPPLAHFLATSPQLLERQKLRLQLALRSLDELAIYTIHGFCRRILEECAYGAGQPMGFEVVEEDPFWQEALIDWWRIRLYPLQGDRAAFYERSLGKKGGGSFTAFQQRFAQLWHRVERPRFDPPPPDLGQVEAALEALQKTKAKLAEQWERRHLQLRRLLLDHPALSRNRTWGYGEEQLVPILERLDGWFRSGSIYEVPDQLKLLSRSRLEASLKRRSPQPFPLDDPFFRMCDQFWEQLQEVRTALLAAHLEDALTFVEARVGREKERRALRTFDDLIREVDRALQSPLGERLREQLRRRFPIALIDEFQDTDPVQYRIFRRLYVEAPRELRLQLVMIGDPKQAIYSFRGADIFAYFQARRDAHFHWTLTANWRSTPALIGAINRLFLPHPRPFLLADIRFQAAQAAPRSAYPDLLLGGRPLPPAFLWFLPGEFDDRGKNRLTKEEARERIDHAVAREVVRLLKAGREGTLRVGGRPLEPRDIAILVRRHEEGRALRAVLARYGVRAVAIERDSVWSSEAAQALLELTEAVAAPANRLAARRALASKAMALPPEELDLWLADEGRWSGWIELLQESQQIFYQGGFMPAFLHLMAKSGMAERIAHRPQPERFLTDLLHAAELIHIQSRSRPELEALIGWIRERIGVERSEETRLRLEDDEALVRIATIHASKGLEWTVVFIPTMWDVRDEPPELLFWHDQEGTPRVTLRDQADREVLRRAEEEQLSEELRLLYVALTRAKSRFYLVFGAIGQKENHSGRSALAYLLLPELWRDGEGVPLEKIGIEPLRKRLGEGMEIVPLPAEEVEEITPLPRPPGRLTLRPFRGAIEGSFAIESFSSMVRGMVHPEGFRAGPAEETLPLPLRFPAGPEVGAFLHRLLERLDFGRIEERQVRELAEEAARRFGLRIELPIPPLTDWLRDIVSTPLAEGLTLKEIPPGRQLREWPFDFATAEIDRERLLHLLDRLEPVGEKPPLRIIPFRGLVTGVVDLLFQHGDRFYLVDYKSNLLGRSFEDYRRERLEEAMRLHRYDLQYALYTLALHRFLKKTLPDYDYDRHFGAVYYLFLRGLKPELGEGYGVFRVRPAREVVERLDREIFRRGGDGVLA